MPRTIRKVFSLILGLPCLALAQTTPVNLTLSEGTNIAAALSPDGRTVAFDLLGRVWTVPKDGGAATVLTDELGDARQPVWTPDGNRIAFQSYRDGTWHVWSVGKDGSGLRQLTFGAFDDREPDFSPDGQFLVFSSDRSGNYDIWRLELATGTLEQLTDDPMDDSGPAVSRDGRSIAFISARKAGPGIWVRTADGLTERWVAPQGTASAPSWSPDGRQLAFHVSSPGVSRLWIGSKGEDPKPISAPEADAFPFRAAWTSPTELLYTGDGHLERASVLGDALPGISFEAKVSFTRHAYVKARRDFDGTGPNRAFGIVAPNLSPDGTTIAFVALGDLWTARDGKLSRLTDDPYVQNEPVWSPDGRSLLYASDRSGTKELWIRDLSTGAERQLTTAAAGASMPSWSPDGKRVVFVIERGLGSELAGVDVASGEVKLIRILFGPSRATWSPDGRLIAVAALRANSARFREGRNDLLFMAPDGTGDRWVVLPGGRGVTARGLDGPAWSPAGHQIAYIQDGLLWVMPVGPDGEPIGPPTRLSTELANTMSWSADGRSLLYQTTDGLRKVTVESGATERIPIDLTWKRRNPTRRIVVHAGRLWDGLADTVRTNMDVVIVGHRIRSVLPHAAAMHRDSVVDASGYTVLPGLVDAHSHLVMGEALGRTWLAYGITTVRDPASEPFQMRERREAVESGVRVGPREFATGRIFDGERIYYAFDIAITPGGQLGQELDRAATLDFSLIKTYVRLPDVIQRRIIEYAHQHGIPVSSHELYPAVAFGADHVEHIRGTSRRGYSTKTTSLYRSYQDVVELLAQSGMSITPTMGIQGGFFNLIQDDPSILDDPRIALVNGPDYAKSLKALPRGGPFASTPGMMASQGLTVKRVLDGGGRVIAGTDAPIIPFGLSLHTEIANYVAGGLTPVQALRTATSGFADAMGLSKDLGSVAAGRLADLMMVDGNPLERIGDTRKVKVVIKNGEVYTEDQLLRGAVFPAKVTPAPR